MNNKLQQPLMFILVGLPGSGKTYLTRQLAQKLKINSVSAEQVRYTILDQPSLQKAEERLVRRIALFLVEELLKAGLPVICDLPAQSARQRLELHKLAKIYKYPVVTLYQQVDKQAAWLRCQSRHSHQVDDKYALNLDQATFDILCSQLEPPTQGEMIVISGVHAFDTQAQIIIRRLFELQLLPEDPYLMKQIIKPGLVNLVSGPAKLHSNLPAFSISLKNNKSKAQ